MKKVFPWLTALLILASCNSGNPNEPRVRIETGVGDIELALFPQKAPKTVAAFLALVDSGYYDNASFYRVLKNDNVPAEYNTGLIQGGIFESNYKASTTTRRIEHESPRQTGLSHLSGTVSMARTTAGSASSEFFICIGDQQQFDSSSRGNSDGLGYAAFGMVKSGMDVVQKIQNKKSNGEHFVTPIRIISVKRL